MNSPRPPKRVVDGVLLLNKPLGISSQQAVSRARAIYHAAKAGHTGTLDPMADGLLPICFGEATKFAHMLLNADKEYLATVRLGVTTTTGDAEGEVIERRQVVADRQAIAAALEKFRGAITQIPPMYSALKRDGVPLYEYARKGIEIDRQPRTVTIHELALLDFAEDTLRLRVRCSKGTYIRTLAQDIGVVLGCGASLSGLTRIAVGTFCLDNAACTLEQLTASDSAERDAKLLPVDWLVRGLPQLVLDVDQAGQLIQGKVLVAANPVNVGLTRVYQAGGRFLGVVDVSEDGQITVRRLIAQRAATAAEELPN